MRGEDDNVMPLHLKLPSESIDRDFLPADLGQSRARIQADAHGSPR